MQMRRRRHRTRIASATRTSDALAEAPCERAALGTAVQIDKKSLALGFGVASLLVVGAIAAFLGYFLFSTHDYEQPYRRANAPVRPENQSNIVSSSLGRRA